MSNQDDEVRRLEAELKLVSEERDELLGALEDVMGTWVLANLCPFNASHSQACPCNYHAAVRRANDAIARARQSPPSTVGQPGATDRIEGGYPDAPYRRD